MSHQSCNYPPHEIKTLQVLFSIKESGGAGLKSRNKSDRSGHRCKGICANYPNFTKWNSLTHRFCKSCCKGIPVQDIVFGNRCPCCKYTIRFVSTWTATKKKSRSQVNRK